MPMPLVSGPYNGGYGLYGLLINSESRVMPLGEKSSDTGQKKPHITIFYTFYESHAFKSAICLATDAGPVPPGDVRRSTETL